MLLIRVKEAIKKKTADSYKFPEDNKMLSDIIHEANLYVCSLCEPSELIRRNNPLNNREYKVLRHIENGLIVKVPEYPEFIDDNEELPLPGFPSSNSDVEKRHLQIDEALTFATIYYACFIISKQKDINFKIQADEIINIYRSNFSLIKYGYRHETMYD